MIMVESKRNETRAGKAKAGPVRTCAGCATHTAPEELVRVVRDPSTGELAVDLAGSGFGRGAWVHPSPACVLRAIKGGFAKSFKAKVVVDAPSFGDAMVAAADRRIEGLLAGAKRGRLVAVGADAVKEALAPGEHGSAKAALVIVARDAAAAARLREVEEAIARGKAIAWSDKARLGALFGRDEVAVCAVLHAGVAEAIQTAQRAAGPFTRRGGATTEGAALPGSGTEGAKSPGSDAAWWSPEVR